MLPLHEIELKLQRVTGLVSFKSVRAFVHSRKITFFVIDLVVSVSTQILCFMCSGLKGKAFLDEAVWGTRVKVGFSIVIVGQETNGGRCEVLSSDRDRDIFI